MAPSIIRLSAMVLDNATFPIFSKKPLKTLLRVFEKF